MKFEVGDKVVVRQTDEDAVVVEIIDEKMVMIEVRGVRFPAYNDQVDYPYFKMFSQKKVPEKKKIYVDDVRREKTQVRKKTTDGVFLRFLPVFDKDVFEDDVVDKLKVYLINENAEGYNFHYNLYFGNESNFDLKNSIQPLSDFYLHDVNFEDVSDNPRFEFEFSLTEPNKKKAPYFERSVKITGKKLFKRVEELQKANEASFAYEVFTHYPDKAPDEKVDLSGLTNAGFRLYNAEKLQENLPPLRTVVDLHIEKLTNNWRQLSNAEILHTQLKEFDKFYDLAIAHAQPKLTVIHGVGEGILKNEIHEILKHKKHVKSFVNQHHALYGFGATEIFF